MIKEEIKIGMKVDYHSMIGGPVTKYNCKIESNPWRIGSGEWIVLISGIRGGVSLKAISEVNGMNITIDETDTWRVDRVTCPRCGNEYTDDVFYCENVHGIDKCSECGQSFTWDTEFNVTFTTKKVDWVHEWKQYNRTQIQMADLRMK